MRKASRANYSPTREDDGVLPPKLESPYIPRLRAHSSGAEAARRKFPSHLFTTAINTSSPRATITDRAWPMSSDRRATGLD